MSSKLFECPICIFKYDSTAHIPKLIPNCGHTLCSSCLDGILKKSSQFPECPFDRRSISPDLKTSSHFASNLFVLQQLKKMTQENHFCNVHKKEQIFVCLTDKVLLCKLCVQEGHANHEILHKGDFELQVQKRREELHQIVEKFDDIKEKHLDEATEKAEIVTVPIVKDNFQHFKKQLKSLEIDILKKIDAFYERSSRITIREALINEDLENKARVLRDFKINSELFQVLESLKDISVPQLTNHKDVELKLRSSERFKTDIEKELGKLGDSLRSIVNHFEMNLSLSSKPQSEIEEKNYCKGENEIKKQKYEEGKILSEDPQDFFPSATKI